MNVIIKWEVAHPVDNQHLPRYYQKMYDFYEEQDYSISGKYQMWYDQYYYLGRHLAYCIKVWINDEVVYDFWGPSQGFITSSYWYNEMLKAKQSEKEFTEIKQAFETCPKLNYNR